MIFMKIFKKNQILMFVAALALVTIGYLAYQPMQTQQTSANYISTTLDTVETANIGDATLVSSSAVINEIVSNVIENKNLTMETNNETDDYFTISKIDRDKMYSQMLDNYQKIIDNVNISSEQKSIATQEISNINNIKNAIMIAENLIKTKGMQDVVIFVNKDSVNVVIKAKELTSNKVSQVQNIVSRELNVEPLNIHISNK